MNAQIVGLPAMEGQSLAIGELIGRYRVEARIGEGGMGVVLMARHLELDMKVAIKVIRAELARDERVVERMMNEARAVASLRSDHVVRVFDVARLADGTPYIVLELVDGPDLDRVLEASGPMPVDLAVAYALDVCLGLSDAHSRGIIHRDIKPENLLVEALTDGTSRVKISDFGIAKQSTMKRREMSVTQESGSVGSPWYMSPEQMVNAPDVDARADVWSLGVVLYELLTGRMPFPGDTAAQVCARVMSMPPVPVDEVRAGLPVAIKHVLERCLEKSRGLRYPDVAELARDLAAISPAGADKARSVARRLGAEDVFMGRTLTNIPVVQVADPQPDALPCSLTSEARFVVPLDQVAGARSRQPRMFAAAALTVVVALGAIPATRGRILALAESGGIAVARAIGISRSTPTPAPSPRIRLPTPVVVVPPTEVPPIPESASTPAITVGPVADETAPPAPRLRERAPRPLGRAAVDRSAAHAPAPAAPVVQTYDAQPNATDVREQPPAEIIEPSDEPFDPYR